MHCWEERGSGGAAALLGATSCGPGDAFMGGCSLKMSRTWTADFFCSVLNLSRLCWEQILWQNSAFSCGHSVLRESYFFL